MAKYRITGPDGTAYEVDAPNEEALNAAVAEKFGAPAEPQIPTEQPAPAQQNGTVEPSLVDRIMSGAKATGSFLDYGARRGAEGVMNVLGLPVDLANAALSLTGLPVSDKPFLGSKSFKDSADQANEITNRAIGLPPPKTQPANAAERVFGRIAEEVGAMAVPAGAALKKADQGIQAARKLPSLARMFVEPAAVNPARFVSKETAAATAAGTGAGIANEVTHAAGYDEKSTGHDVGDLVGAMAGLTTYGVGSHVLPKLGEVFNAVRGSPNYADKVVRDSVTDTLIDAAGAKPSAPGQPVDTENLVNTIMGGRRVAEKVPGYVESTADRAQSPGLAALEYSRQSGPNSGEFTQRRAENTQAIDNAINRSEPQGNPGALRSELELERDRRLTDADVLAQNAREDAERAALPLTPQSTPAARGNTVRTGLEDARDAARQRTDSAYATADVSGNPADPVSLADTLDGVTNGLTQVERGLAPRSVIDRVRQLGQTAEPGPVDTGILDAAGNPITRAPEPPAPVTLKEATDLKSELQRLQRAALADPRAEQGGRNAARVLGRYIDAVDGYIATNLSPAEQEALTAARGAKFDEAEAFTRRGDPVAGALARNEGGFPQMRDERVAATFVDPANMDRLFAQADTPAVRQAIREEVLSRADLRNPEAIQSFQQDYQEQLRRFPGLNDEIARAGELRGAEAAATGAQSALMREIGPQGRSVVAKYLQYGDENAEKALRGVLAAKDPARATDELLGFVNDDPKAVEGARKVFWNIMQKTARRAGETTADISGAQPWLPKALDRFVNDPATAAVAERLYRDAPEHWNNIKEISGAIQGLDLRNSAKAPNTSGTAQGVSNVLTPETLQSRFYQYKAGKISGSFLATSIAAVAGRRAVARARADAVGRMLDEALLNPEVAATLLKENNPANRAALARKAKGWIGNEASTFLDIVTPENDDDKTKRAIMDEAK